MNGNVLDRLVFAFQNEVEELKQEAVSYVSVANILDELLLSNKWADLEQTDPSLAQKIADGARNKP
jgi:hypothetical protein